MAIAALVGAAAIAGAIRASLEPGLTWSVPRLWLYVLLPGALGAVFVAVAVFRRRFAGLALAYFCAATVAALAAELYLWPGATVVANVAKADVSEVPYLCPFSFAPGEEVMRLDGVPALPLGGIAGSKLGTARDGATRLADDHGFNNPAGVWARVPTDLLAVGDSFTLGADVPIGEGFVDRIRERVPATVNLGCGGNGPLTELGGLVEYGPHLRPRVVLWFFYEGNDLTKDIYNELESPILIQYLEAGFRQGLFGRQAAIDTGLSAKVASMSERPATWASLVDPDAELRPRFLLTTLRTRLGLRHAIKPGALDSLERVLKRARDEAAAWDGRLVLVYLPAETRYTSLIAGADAEGYARRVREIAAAQQIPVIDVAAELAREPEPRKLYAGHFTAAGYEKVAAIVLSELQRLGLVDAGAKR